MPRSLLDFAQALAKTLSEGLDGIECLHCIVNWLETLNLVSLFAVHAYFQRLFFFIWPACSLVILCALRRKLTEELLVSIAFCIDADLNWQTNWKNSLFNSQRTSELTMLSRYCLLLASCWSRFRSWLFQRAKRWRPQDRASAWLHSAHAAIWCSSFLPFLDKVSACIAFFDFCSLLTVAFPAFCLSLSFWFLF